LSLHEYYDWNALISEDASRSMVNDIDLTIKQGRFWHNSPPYQTNINIFGLNTQHWINLKMSFIWSCFAFMKREAQIKSVKSWGYKTNVETQEDRDTYWHQHLRDGSLVVSGVYYLSIPEGCDLSTSGTEFAPDGPDSPTYHAEARPGNWIIFPGKTWHRPGILTKKDWRFIVAADMEV
jgi:hypothetical protein